MSDELVKNLRNMAEYNDRREFGADYKDDIHWKAADRIEELERHLTNVQEAADEASRQYHVETEGHDKYIEELERENALLIASIKKREPWFGAWMPDDVYKRLNALREQEEG